MAEGNHDLTERYLREARYRNDGTNIRFGLQLEDAYLGYVEERSEALDNDQPVPRLLSLLEHAIRLKYPEMGVSVEWCHDGYSRLIDGIEVGNHGFRGANGAKGTVAGFARLGRKISIGDKHSSEINEGVYVAGAMTLRMGYNKGASGWSVSHVLNIVTESEQLSQCRMDGGDLISRWSACRLLAQKFDILFARMQISIHAEAIEEADHRKISLSRTIHSMGLFDVKRQVATEGSRLAISPLGGN